MKKLLTGLLLAALGLQLFGCAAEGGAANGTEPTVTEQKSDVAGQDAAADFALALLRRCDNGEQNCVLSPYSILNALAMAENGADGQTLRQFEEVLGMPCDTLNAYLRDCVAAEGAEVAGANSIWLRDEEGLALKEDYRALVEELFGAEVYTAPFDADTLARLNNWVKEHTKERIERIVDNLQDASTVLVNALSFDAKWEKPYNDSNVVENVFTAADGTEQRVQMLCGQENAYLDDGKATGFLKPYEGGKYSFVALLPNEGTTAEDYLSSLTGSALLELIHNASQERVTVKMPKLKTETSLQLADVLYAMGLTDAFTGAADFSRMASTPQQIDQVIHKTWLSVDEEGTEAAAATAIIMTKSARPMIGPTVILDRPYVMAIIDNETDCLLFLGVINQIPD